MQLQQRHQLNRAKDNIFKLNELILSRQETMDLNRRPLKTWRREAGNKQAEVELPESNNCGSSSEKLKHHFPGQ